MPRPPAATLHKDLARAVLDHLRASGAAPGTPVGEAALAAAVGTSRSPVRGAVALLLESGALERREDGRLAVGRIPEAEEGADDALYWRIAAARLAGELPELVGEAALMRRFAVPRGEVHRALLACAAEGWAERAPTGAWRFLPVVDGVASHEEAYRFRRAIEPAALLEPGFALPPAVAARLRAEQEALLAAPAPDARAVFEGNSGFHLALTNASGNRFLADAGARITRLRRLAGYVIGTDRTRLATQCEEHLAILARIEAGDRAGAAALLLRHLDAGHAARAALLGGVTR